jgi:hypothetical protein
MSGIGTPGKNHPARGQHRKWVFIFDEDRFAGGGGQNSI